MKKIVHFSSVHKRRDIRIFLKQCRTLQAHGYKVTFVVADGKGDSLEDGIQIVDAGAPAANRISRMLKTTESILRVLCTTPADLYHFHDPELIPVGLKLKKKFPSAKVVFDSHENYSDDIKDKPYFPLRLGRFVATIYRYYERFSVRKLDAVVAATPSIKRHFLRMGVHSVDINNYPLLAEFSDVAVSEGRQFNVVYLGGITKIRGVKEVVDSLCLDPNLTMTMAGPISESFLAELKSSPGWPRVDYLGEVDRRMVSKVLSSAKVAVVNFLPAANHIESQPNKMFEYMSAGLPVVASNFPLWREIIEGNECGICVDPTSPADIHAAINKICSDDGLAREMGCKGREAVMEKFHWEKEGRKLLEFYDRVLKK